MEFLIVVIFACAVFALCFVVFLFKDRKEEGPPRLHRCGEGDDCHCYGKPNDNQAGDLVNILGSPPSGCSKMHEGSNRCCASNSNAVSKL